MHCNLKAARCRASRFGLFFAKIILRMCSRNQKLSLRASGQNSDIAIRFSGPAFLKNNNLKLEGLKSQISQFLTPSVKLGEE